MKFKDLSIRRKITYLYLPFVVLPIIMFFLISTNLYEKSIVDRSLNSMEDNNILVANRIDDMLSEAESSATYLTITINTILNSQEYQGQLVDEIKQYNLISNELSYATLIYDNIDSIAFYDIDRRLYYTHHSLEYNKYKIEIYPFYHELKESTGNILWTDIENRNFLINQSETVVTLGKKVWNINTGETIGFLFINITDKSITNVFSNQISDYYIFNKENIVLSSLSSLDKKDVSPEVLDFLADEKESQLIHKSNKQLISKFGLERLNWVLLSLTDLDNLTTDFNHLLVVLSLMLLGIIAVDILISSFLNRLITNPIIKLKGGIEEIAKGNFDYRFNVKTNDEIGLFADSFNNMSSRIEALLNQVELEEEQKRTFELALIQQQIKPHFLYNSLDIILKLSEMGQARKAQKVTKRLADYYKNSLSSGSDIVNLQTEIKLTKDYLELQKIRYSDILDYEVNLAEYTEAMVIPKLTLQPIVENAIYHGLKYREDLGKITITDRLARDGYCIIIQDNGVGIKEERLKAIMNYLSKNEFDYSKEISESFGMRNVNYRLKLFFGQNYGLTMTSEVGKGTEVIIKIPKDNTYD